MKINPITTVSPVQPSIARDVSPWGKSKAQPTAQDAVAAPVTSPSPLTEETKKNLAFATQEVSPHGEHEHKVPPAQQARAALATNPELAALPFGAIVSALARGLPVPTVAPASPSHEESTPDPVVGEPTTPLAGEPPAENLGPTIIDLITDVPVTTDRTDPLVEDLLSSLSAPEEV